MPVNRVRKVAIVFETLIFIWNPIFVVSALEIGVSIFRRVGFELKAYKIVGVDGFESFSRVGGSSPNRCRKSAAGLLYPILWSRARLRWLHGRVDCGCGCVFEHVDGLDVLACEKVDAGNLESVNYEKRC